jgi:hypothetical protein
MKLAIVLTLLLIVGCVVPTVNSPEIKYPIIQIPSKPQLHIIVESELSGLSDDVIRKIITNDSALKTYISKLKAAIEEYNSWAIDENR